MKTKQPIIAWILLVITSITFLYIRLRLLSMPLERDEGEYAYAGQQILHGGIPYRDIYNMKFPGVYYFYALLLALFGNSIVAIRLGTLLVNCVTVIFLFKTVEKFKNRIAALFAASTFIAISSAPNFQGLMANTEHFVNLFIVISAYFLVSWINDRRNYRLLLTGLMTGFACLMKQPGLYFIAVALFAIFIYDTPPKINFTKFIQRTLILLSGFAIPILLLLGLLIATNTFSEFVFLTIKYGSNYISYTSNSQGIIKFFTSFATNIRNDHVFWILIVLAVIFSYRLLPKKSFSLLLSWFIFSIASIFPGYYFRQHYFLLLVPVSAIYSGILFDYLLSIKNNAYQYSTLLASLLFVIAVSYILVGERQIFFTDSPSQASEAIYGTQFTEAVTIADSIKNYIPANQDILVVGSHPEIYFYTKRTAASSYVYMYPLIERQPLRDSMLSEFTHQALLNKPAVLIVTYDWAWESIIEKNVLGALMSSKPGFKLKGFCYKADNGVDKFLWNVSDSTINPDRITWQIYVRKSN